MPKIPRENYFELAAFLMDYHSGQWSRGYRLLSRMHVRNMTSALMAVLRETEAYQYLVEIYAGTV